MKRKTISELRQASGMSPVDVASKLGVSLASVYNWENRTHEPSATTVRQLAALFGVLMDDIAFEVDVSWADVQSFGKRTKTVAAPKSKRRREERPESADVEEA